MKTITLNISGMGCSGCANTVESALQSLDGVDTAKVELDKETARVSFDDSRVQLSDFEKAIDDSGYTMKGVKA
ncbi:heavy-metal-associated domain-containing protein [Gracilimonas sp. BCB1]|uniref:heavy-metal-associated domain-containing protein n=1 Tax=Gracilimonas sp. BCB1 TaxID=3152362 RepID=UPI0032D92591